MAGARIWRRRDKKAAQHGGHPPLHIAVAGVRGKPAAHPRFHGHHGDAAGGRCESRDRARSHRRAVSATPDVTRRKPILNT